MHIEHCEMCPAMADDPENKRWVCNIEGKELCKEGYPENVAMPKWCPLQGQILRWVKPK
jgi:hypothetical protein